MTELAGIDVSAIGQGPAFPWPSWKGRIQFAGIKISEGTTFADPDARRNIAGARSIGAAVMGYHFLHAGESGKAQADWFMECCKNAAWERGDLMAIDAEQLGLDGRSPAELWQVAVEFADVIHGHYGGGWPVDYTDITLALAAPSAAGQCPLWLANPSGTPMTHVGPWKVISFEQTGQKGIDSDRFYGTPEQLAKLGIPKLPAPAPKPPQPPVPGKPTLADAQAALKTLTDYIG